MVRNRLHSALALVAACGALLMAPEAAQADFIDHFTTPDDVGETKVPRFGTSRVLVLVVQVEGFPAHDMEAIERFFSTEPAPAGEFRFTDFHERASLGAYRPEAEVVGPIVYDACPLPEDYFGFEDCYIPRGLGDTLPEILDTMDVGLAILEDFLTRADEEFEVDFSAFDVNGPEGEPDGWIDGVLLLHNIDFGGYAIPLYFLRKEGVLELDGTSVNIVGMADTPEVAVHEFGHLLGWADLYDEIGRTKGLQYSHMGSWGYEEAPPMVDGFSRMRAGWVEPTVVDVGAEMTGARLRPFADSGDLIQLGTGSEYYLLENRGPTGDDYIDSDIRERGLAVYHVNLKEEPDDAMASWPLRLGGGCVNCEVWSPLVMNEQADGKFELQLPGNRRDDAGDLFSPGDSFLPALDNTEPVGDDNRVASSNYYDGAVSGVSVTNIQIDGDDILVDVAVEEPCAILDCGEGTCEEGRCIPPEEEPEPDPEPADDTGDEDDEAPPAEASNKSDGGCQSAPGAPGPLGLAVALLIMALGLGRRRAFAAEENIRRRFDR